MTKKSITDIVGTIVAELTPLSSDERHRVIDASLTLLGEGRRKTVENNPQPALPGSGDTASLPPPARIWIQQNSLTIEELQQIFHMSEGGADVIAAGVPGKTRGDQVHNVYLLIGVSRLLATGDATFDDKAARSLCESMGCYDSTNHAKYLKDMGNDFAPTKNGGRTLTAPGKKRAADLIKMMSKSS